MAMLLVPLAMAISAITAKNGHMAIMAMADGNINMAIMGIHPVIHPVKEHGKTNSAVVVSAQYHNPFKSYGHLKFGTSGLHCTTIKFILGGRFKESKLFSEQKKRIGVFLSEILSTFNI